MSQPDLQARERTRGIARRPAVWVATLVLLLFSINRAPASLLLGLVQNEVAGFQVETVSGSVWRGRASGLSLPWQGRDIKLDHLSWRMPLLSALLPGYRFKIEADGQQHRISATVRYRGSSDWRISDVQAELPIESILAESEMPLQGRIKLKLRELTVTPDAGIVMLDGRADLVDMAVDTGRRLLRVGNFEAALRHDRQGGFTAEMVDRDGPLFLSANLSANRSGAYFLRGELHTRAHADPRLAYWLPRLAESRGRDHHFAVHREGSLWSRHSG